MAKSINDEMNKIQILKRNDPDISLLILFDRTWLLIDDTIKLELKHLRVTRPQVAVLAMLSREDRPLTIDELAKSTQKEFNSVSVLINRMEKKELVKKVKKDSDLKTYVVLTKKGSILYHKKVTERSVHMIFDKLTNEEKKSFISILNTLCNATSDFLGLSYKPPFLPLITCSASCVFLFKLLKLSSYKFVCSYNGHHKVKSIHISFILTIKL
jgi:DNA-binding MarR family transcriptional regulator